MYLCASRIIGQVLGKTLRSEPARYPCGNLRVPIHVDAIGHFLEVARARSRCRCLQDHASSVLAEEPLPPLELLRSNGTQLRDKPRRIPHEGSDWVLYPKVVVRHRIEEGTHLAPERPLKPVTKHDRNAACRNARHKARRRADVARRTEAELRTRHHPAHAFVLAGAPVRAHVVLPARSELCDELFHWFVLLGREGFHSLDRARRCSAVAGLPDYVSADADLDDHVLVATEKELAHLAAHALSRAADIQPTCEIEEDVTRDARGLKASQRRLVGLVTHVEGTPCHDRRMASVMGLGAPEALHTPRARLHEQSRKHLAQPLPQSHGHQLHAREAFVLVHVLGHIAWMLHAHV
mmetsp:Transcript_8715/g.24033  ORF Transcript_8715/g.24033 Transcript_8715/m.24033 type:complete len:351 (-) Transcript_8715:497-1549(-)|eukprot:CAMPEP_0185209378 /NCGR_PEP_ID=MMETSP1140-20130426/63689_1 /TAXON_ID=298111 /ORGANISM="Pavlova sp., Strain CCMP459" /LENGTH=350 /DNA_ID=CAMNT_0027777141 /DNA_START=481 /DNA_END=1533 /DNA_ORIENTATION=-